MPTLRRIGLKDLTETPWTVFINDLQVIVELTSTPAEFLHFLEWRTGLPVGDEIRAIDELDFLGNYFFGGFHDLL